MYIIIIMVCKKLCVCALYFRCTAAAGTDGVPNPPPLSLSLPVGHQPTHHPPPSIRHKLQPDLLPLLPGYLPVVCGQWAPATAVESGSHRRGHASKHVTSSVQARRDQHRRARPASSFHGGWSPLRSYSEPRGRQGYWGAPGRYRPKRCRSH